MTVVVLSVRSRSVVSGRFPRAIWQAIFFIGDGEPTCLPACSGLQAQLLTAVGLACCASLASSRPLRLPICRAQVLLLDGLTSPSLPASSCLSCLLFPLVIRLQGCSTANAMAEPSAVVADARARIDATAGGARSAQGGGVHGDAAPSTGTATAEPSAVAAEVLSGILSDDAQTREPEAGTEDDQPAQNVHGKGACGQASSTAEVVVNVEGIGFLHSSGGAVRPG